MMTFKDLFNSCVLVAVLPFLCCCNGRNEAGSDEDGSIDPSQIFYNPVITHNCPDPSIIDNRERDGYFYAYSTQNGANGASDVVYLPVYRSRDLVNWELVGNAFGGMTRPEWGDWEATRVWAPDINYINGKYVLYYALGNFSKSALNSSGVAVSDSPSGPFKDLGMIVSQSNTGVSNSIDPFYIEDADGKKYLFWGSYGAGSGIWAVQLTDDGLAIKEGFKPVQIAQINREGTYIYKKGEYYYIFVSRGTCCEGAASTYHLVVGRSKNILGPYKGPNGESFLDYDYDYTILSGNVNFIGPGHNGEIITDDAGQEWMIYHAFWKGNGYNGRCMLLQKILWASNGWPYFNSLTPASYSLKPVLK